MEGSAEVAPNSRGCLYSSLPSLFAHAAASREHNSSHAFNAASIDRQPLRMFFTYSLSRPHVSMPITGAVILLLAILVGPILINPIPQTLGSSLQSRCPITFY
jgi:hypothetical protein